MIFCYSCVYQTFLKLQYVNTYLISAQSCHRPKFAGDSQTPFLPITKFCAFSSTVYEKMSGYGKPGVKRIRWCSRLILGTKEAISTECYWDTPEYLNSQKRLNKLRGGNAILARTLAALGTKHYPKFIVYWSVDIQIIPAQKITVTSKILAG